MSTIQEQSGSVTAAETEEDTKHAQTQTEDDVTEIDDSLALPIFTALAEQEGRSNVQLYDHIDIEALDRLVAHAAARPDSEWELTFAVEDSEVTVASEGTFSVE